MQLDLGEIYIETHHARIKKIIKTAAEPPSFRSTNLFLLKVLKRFVPLESD